jgi:bifunctional DNA-binding transcriptional regulator/antitoxin component of YhaV-PrlF toxin-antitoxin module
MDGTGRITIPELIREEMMISGKTKFIIIQESKDRLILERVKE